MKYAVSNITAFTAMPLHLVTVFGVITLLTSVVLGVIAEPELVRGQKEISSYGGWRSYIATL